MWMLMLERNFAPKKREDNTFSPSFLGAIHFLLGVSFFFVCFGRLSGCLDIGAHASGNLQRVDGGVYNRVIRLLQVAICAIFTLPKKKNSETLVLFPRLLIYTSSLIQFAARRLVRSHNVLSHSIQRQLIQIVFIGIFVLFFSFEWCCFGCCCCLEMEKKEKRKINRRRIALAGKDFSIPLFS